MGAHARRKRTHVCRMPRITRDHQAGMPSASLPHPASWIGCHYCRTRTAGTAAPRLVGRAGSPRLGFTLPPTRAHCRARTAARTPLLLLRTAHLSKKKKRKHKPTVSDNRTSVMKKCPGGGGGGGLGFPTDPTHIPLVVPNPCPPHTCPEEGKRRAGRREEERKKKKERKEEGKRRGSCMYEK